MATVTGLTAERMLAIEGASVIDGEVLGDHLILSKFDGTQIDAGNVRGPVGPTGPTGPPAVFPGEVSNLIIDNNLYLGNLSDTRLYRSAAGVVATDGHMVFIGNVDHVHSYINTSGQYGALRRIAATGHHELLGQIGVVLAPAAGQRIYITDHASGVSGALDTTLYRSAASSLRTEGIFRALSYLYAYDGDALQLRLGNSSGFSTIEFGLAYDTRIYRYSAQNLKTDGNLLVAYTVVVDHNNGGGSLYFGSASDTSLRRQSANQLYTPGAFSCGLTLAASQDLYVRSGTAYQVYCGYISPGYPAIYFGSPGDSAIRRIGAGSIVSDGSLGVQIAAGYTIDSAGMVHATSFPTSSDDRLKKDVAQLDGVLDKLMKIRGVSFRWREDHGTHRDYTKDSHRERTDLQLGVVAQDVEKMFPELTMNLIFKRRSMKCSYCFRTPIL
jgi:hypothetical protein